MWDTPTSTQACLRHEFRPQQSSTKTMSFPHVNMRLLLMTLTGLLTTAAGLSSASQTGEKPSVTDLKVFGCSIEFLHMATQTYLEDPIWDKLQQSMEYCIIFKDCSKVLPSQELLEGCPIHNIPLAVHVPMRGSSPRRGVRRSATPTPALSQVLDLSAQRRVQAHSCHTPLVRFTSLSP